MSKFCEKWMLFRINWNQFCLCSYSMLMKGFRYFVFRTSAFGLISFMSFDGSKDKQFLYWAWSLLHSQFKAHTLIPLEGSNKGHKMNTVISSYEFHISYYNSNFAWKSNACSNFAVICKINITTKCPHQKSLHHQRILLDSKLFLSVHVKKCNKIIFEKTPSLSFKKNLTYQL